MQCILFPKLEFLKGLMIAYSLSENM